MHNVSRFEANLLRLLYFFLRREPVERALPLVENRMQAPPCLSRAAVRLAQDALAKGCVYMIVREREGWRSERFLRGERVADGRLWERTPPDQLGLSFSRHTLEFLVWITAASELSSTIVLYTSRWSTMTVRMYHFLEGGEGAGSASAAAAILILVTAIPLLLVHRRVRRQDATIL